MASDEVMDDISASPKRPALTIESLKNKKFKTDDLPLSAAQHADINNLLVAFKKKGGYDNMRRAIWAEFNDGDTKTKFLSELLAVAEAEIEREPAHLSRERGKAATLIEGAVDRSDVYKTAERSIDELTQKHLASILESVRAIRRQEIGDEAAAREEQAGNKTDQDYEEHVKAKREERDKVWREELRKQQEIEDEERRVKAEEQRKKREAERKKEEEERARRKQIDEERRAERERLREEQRAIDDQREREREERYERRRRRTESGIAIGIETGVGPVIEAGLEIVTGTVTVRQPPPVDEKSLEEAALQLLLKDAEEHAAKARMKPEFDFEEAEAIENGLKPPPSTAHQGRGITAATPGVVARCPIGGSALVIALAAVVAAAAAAAATLVADAETVIWRIVVDTVTSEMIAATDLAAVAADQSAALEIETGTALDRVTATTVVVVIAVVIAVVKEAKTAIETMTVPQRSRYSPSPIRRHSRSRRSRSRPRGRDNRSKSRSPILRRRSRSRRTSRTRRPSPVSLDIDRYVPATSNRSKSPRRRVRSPERLRGGELDRYMPGSEEKESSREHKKESKVETTDGHADSPLESDDRRTRRPSPTRRRSRSRRRSPSRRRSRSRRRSYSRRSRSRSRSRRRSPIRRRSRSR
ncbi:arginine rich protein [Penicillium chermesinum]|nr:arginine rich protein [Penicillium chermesinum]